MGRKQFINDNTYMEIKSQVLQTKNYVLTVSLFFVYCIFIWGRYAYLINMVKETTGQTLLYFNQNQCPVICLFTVLSIEFEKSESSDKFSALLVFVTHSVSLSSKSLEVTQCIQYLAQ